MTSESSRKAIDSIPIVRNLESIKSNHDDPDKVARFGRLTGPIICKQGKEIALSVLLNNAFETVATDARTEEWIAFKYEDDPGAPSAYGVLDTFLTPESRTERRTGAIHHELQERGDDVLQCVPDVLEVSILGEIKHPSGGGTGNPTKGLSVGLHVQLEAKAGEEDAINSILQEEDCIDTAVWLRPYRRPGTTSFGVMVFFSEEEARETYLKSKFHQNLLERQGAGSTGAITVIKLDVLAAKLCARDLEISQSRTHMVRGTTTQVRTMMDSIKLTLV